MIPQRVKLKGFLCYVEEQEVSFDGNATLWMLSGLNGSGKSSIFDAVTYALFGHHRGGSTNAVELINKDSESLLVEFDFLLEGQPYRAKRTYRRNARGGGSGTQQLLRFEKNGNNSGNWEPIEDTNLKAGFTEWIEEKIGLSYETFTSSVLLLQNKAEKLLDSSPSGRHQVLASIVGLERDKALHERAVDQRKDLDAKLDVLRNRLSALPAVTPIEMAEVEGRVETARESREQARAEVERLQGLEFQSRAWADLQRRLTAARLRHGDARNLFEDAPSIEKALEHLRELREITPRMQNIALLRGQLFDADGKTRKLQEQKSKLSEQFAQREHALGQARDKRVTAKTLIAEDEAGQRDVAARLVQSSATMEKLREYERQEGEVQRLQQELATLPADPAQAVARARELTERLATLAPIVPQLVRLQARREELRLARATEQAARLELQQVEARGKQRKADVDRLKPLLDDSRGLLQENGDRATEARTLLAQAKESLQQVTHLDGAKVCRACGQALTPGHIQDERRRRGEEVKKAEVRCEETNAALRKAKSEEQRLRTEHTQAETAYHEARDQYRDELARGKQAATDVERLLAACAEAHAELPDPYRTRVGVSPVADWAATVYPTRVEIDTLRTEAAGLSSARQRLQQAEQVLQQWGRLQAGEAAALKSMARLQAELPANRAAVRQLHNELQLQDRTLDAGLRSQRTKLREIDDEVERLSRERDQAQTQLSRHDTQLKEQEVVRQHAEQNIAMQVKALPPTWRARGEKAGTADVNALNQEREELEAAGTEQRGQRLHQARLNLEVLRQEVENLESQEGELLAEARQDAEVLGGQLTVARRQERSCEEELSQAGQQRALLESYRRQREELNQEEPRLDADLTEAKLLAELLGRERLQLYLVRQAERQVVEYANDVLDRLSGGHLYLKLSGEANGEGNAAKALDLEAYNRSTGEKPINVAFLSGSQKFRVAVSLALGIGQYASRQHRPIEAVIIDEGFGCLDSQGRQGMIQELQNLRNQMRCILLVSHQEEFADAFPDGFHFFLEGGAARIKPFQK